MTRQVATVLLVFLIVDVDSLGQSKSEQIKQLQKIAGDNDQRAKKAEEQAEQYNAIAQLAQKEAERQRYLALAMSLSLKSLEIEDKSLSALLALQAYNFNSRYQGYVFDKSNYDGLLNALKRFGLASTSLTAHTHRILALTVKPENSMVISLGNDGRVMKWTKRDSRWEGEEATPAREGYTMYTADLTPEGRLWVIGAKKQQQGEVGVYDLTYTSKRIQGFNSEISKINFTPEARSFYALCNAGKSIFLSDFKLAIEVISSPEKIILMDLSHDGSKLAGLGAGGNLYIWDIKNEYSSSVYKIDSESPMTSMAFTPIGKNIALGNERGEITVFDLRTRAFKKSLAVRSGAIEQIVFSSSGQLMAVSDRANSIRIWNMADLHRLPLTIKEEGLIGNILFSPDDSQLLCALKEVDFSIHTWPLNMDVMAKQLCQSIKRNMTAGEWEAYVGDVPYQPTCANLPANNR